MPRCKHVKIVLKIHTSEQTGLSRHWWECDAEGCEERFTRSTAGFVTTFGVVAHAVHLNAQKKGWWEEDRADSEMIALAHSELSEMLEGIRRGNPPSDKIPEFSAAEEEAADVIIRLMDQAEARSWRLARAILAKMKFNEMRPHKHGGKAF